MSKQDKIKITDSEKLIIANKELAYQNKEKEKRANELFIANKELAFQNEEKEKRAAELVLVNKELLFQNKEKAKLAAELVLANKELAFQNKEKEKQAAELVLVNKELLFQNEEKEKRAAELVLANKELAFQNKEKAKRAAELIKAIDKEIRMADSLICDNALNASEIRYRRLFESAKDGILILNAETGMIVDVNPFLIDLLGYSKEQFLEKEIWEIGFFKDIIANREKFSDLQQKKYVRYEDLPLETVGGRKINVEFVSNVYQANNQQVIQCNIRDITERKKTEKLLIRSEEKYHSIFNNIQDVYYETSLDGTILEVSPSIEINTNGQYHRDDLIGKSMYEHYSFPGGRHALIETLKEQGSVTDYEIILKNRDGSQIPCSISSKIQFDAQGKPLKIIGTMRDNTERKKTEKLLTESEEKFRSYIENSPIGIFIVDETGHYQDCNHSAHTMIGYTRNELLNTNIPELLPLQDFENGLQNFQKLLVTGSNKFEINLLRKDKTIIPVILEAVKIPENNMFITYCTDITERKQIEESLKEREFFFKESQNAAFIGSYKTDFIKNHWESSEVLEQIFGIDKDYDRSITGWLDIVHPDDREMIDQYLSDEVISKHNPFNKEYRIVRKNNGETRWMLGLGQVDFNDEGKVIRMIGTIQDITERKQIEETLRKSESEFRLLAESMPQIVWITDADGMNTYFNQQWMDYTGLTLEESYGHGWNIPFHPDDRQMAFDAWQDAVNNNGIYSIECRLCRADGVYKWWLIRGMPIMDEQGRILKWFGTCTDIHEIKLIEKELLIAKEHAEESDKLKTAFLQNMSHEIRTPLNGIIGFSDLLNQGNLDQDEIKEFTHIISQSGKRLLEIVNNVLDISKIQTGQIKIEQKSFLINSLFSDLFTFFSPLAASKNLILNYHDKNDKLITVFTDESKLHQIFTNLINNSIKFTKNGNIDFGFEIKEDIIQFYVKDTGIGIPAASFDKVFERFTQVDLSITRGYEGAGLGLAICKGLVELLGGKIWLESEIKKGTTFFFTLPYSQVNQPSQPEIKESPRNKFRGKILLAEDDWVSANYLSKLLKKANITIILAENGVQAVEFVKTIPDIDLILMDMRMPLMDGFEATKIIKQIRPDLPIIAQTAYAFSAEIEHMLAIGCDDYLAKPIEINKIKAILDKYLK